MFDMLITSANLTNYENPVDVGLQVCVCMLCQPSVIACVECLYHLYYVPVCMGSLRV